MRFLPVLVVLAVPAVLAGCEDSTLPSRGGGTTASDDSEHAVLVYLKLTGGDFGTEEERDAVHGLSDQLRASIESRGAGEFDGDEFGGGGCTLYMYGPDADILFQAVEAILRESPLTAGGHAIKRYGEATDAQAREDRIDF